MKTEEIFSYVYDECPIGVLSYLDENYLPKARLIEVVAGGKGGLYFIINRDQEMARDILRNKDISFTSYIDGSSIKNSTYVNIQGQVKRSDESWDLVCKLNPDLEDMYKDDQARMMVFLFFIHEGQGVLKEKGQKAQDFAFGMPKGQAYVYEVNSRCVRCMDCVAVCPVEAIKPRGARVAIDQKLCVHCSACYKTCAFSAIDRS